MLLFITLLPFYPFVLWRLRREDFGGAARVRANWLRLFFKLAGLRISLKYADGRPVEMPVGAGPLIYISNHRSLLDAGVLIAAHGGYLAFMAKAELRSVPFIRAFFDRIDIMVERENARAAAKAMLQAARRLEAGEQLVIFPEGGIFPRGGAQMLPFKEGAVQIAIRAGVPIQPLVIIGAEEILPDEAKYARPGRVDVILLPQVSAADLRAKDAAEVSAMLHAAMSNLLEQY